MQEVWDLESIFPGGSSSPAFATFLDEMATAFDAVETRPLPEKIVRDTGEGEGEGNTAVWVALLLQLYDLNERMMHASAFINCLLAANTRDDKALELMGQREQLSGRLGTIWKRTSAKLAAQDEADWQALLAHPQLAPNAFHLNEQRDEARRLMPPEMEALATELATDGYHTWGNLYNFIVGQQQLEFEDDTLSLGQLQSKYMDDPDRATRSAAFAASEERWRELAPTLAQALNNQAGFRQTLYKWRGWTSILDEPLANNRLTRDTLDTMWHVINSKSGKLKAYFAAKANLLGVEKLAWYDLWAPVGNTTRQFNYADAAEFVVDSIRPFHPAIAEFCRHAIDSHWVEAEDRPHKRMGAFCTRFPLNKEPRVFMTFNGSFNGLRTLAHELGHGYHGWVLNDMSVGAQMYTMSVAETASTFNEMIVKDASVKAAETRDEKLSLLGSKLDDAASYLMNINARYQFELAFFEQRAKRQVTVDELNALMETAQKSAYQDGLGEYHPLFWASKLHFYITRAPFYNFPYTFGYLFSNGVYAQALAEGESFRARYDALLRDTGSMTTEQLARKHLGVDLQQPEFWTTAVDRILADVDEFTAIAN